MMRTYFLLLSYYILQQVALGQEYPPIAWEHSYGGSDWDRSTDIIALPDGYLMVGQVESNDGDVQEFRGIEDVWLTKLDQAGELVWQRTYGGSNHDHIANIEFLESGDLIMVGSSASGDGDLEPNNGSFDLWVLRIDINGNVLWSRSYGGLGEDAAFRAYPIENDHTMVCGYQEMNNTEAGWLMEIDQNGDMVWDETYQGPLDRMLAGLAPADDGKWFLTGTTGYDLWVLMTDSNGEVIWEDAIGGTQYEVGWALAKAGENAFVVAGNTQSNNGDVTGYQGYHDAWVVMLDTTGQIQWAQTFGGGSFDSVSEILILPSGEILALGTTDSYNGDVTGHAGESDAWLLLINPDGELIWDRTLGGDSHESGSGLALADDGIIVAANSMFPNGDVSSNQGSYDLWVVKLQTGPVTVAENISVDLQLFPNPSNGISI
jgi:hypothetical protein